MKSNTIKCIAKSIKQSIDRLKVCNLSYILQNKQQRDIYTRNNVW